MLTWKKGWVKELWGLNGNVSSCPIFVSTLSSFVSFLFLKSWSVFSSNNSWLKKKAESNWIKQCCIRMSQCLIEATKNGHIDKWVHWLMKAASLCNSCRELHNVVCWPLFLRHRFFILESYHDGVWTRNYCNNIEKYSTAWPSTKKVWSSIHWNCTRTEGTPLTSPKS